MCEQDRTLHRYITSADAEAHRAYEIRLASMRENGVSFHDVPRRYVSDPKVNPEYERKYAELNAAAFGLAAASRNNLDFLPRESPDFEVRQDGVAIAFLEIVQSISQGQAQYDGLLDQVNVAVRLRSAVDPVFAGNIDQVFCELVLPTPPNKRDRSRVVDELVSLLGSGMLNVADSAVIRIGSNYPNLHAAGAQAIATRQRGIGHLSFRAPVRTGEAISLEVILEVLADKRETAAGYEGSPLWLVMYSDSASEPSLIEIPNAIEQLLTIAFEIAPFERVFIGGQRQMLEITRRG